MLKPTRNVSAPLYEFESWRHWHLPGDYELEGVPETSISAIPLKCVPNPLKFPRIPQVASETPHSRNELADERRCFQER
jgi:hypothetical protein